MRWAVVCILLLAGCASNETAAPAETIDEAGLRLEGVVVDARIVPVAGANVTILGTNATAVTDGDGRFAFPVAEAGTASIEVRKEGFVSQRIDVTIQEGMESVQVVLEPVAVPFPTSEVREWTGIIQCSVRSPDGALALCNLVDDLTGVVGDDAEERYEDVRVPPTFVQAEMEWTSTQPAGESLRLMLTDDYREGLDNYATATGASPLMVSADNETLRFKHLDSQGLFIRVFTGDLQDLGISLTVQQTFTVYTSIFEDYRPDEAWRFTDGGGLPPP